ncbi:MAG: hypothetical protein IPP49_16350 [Saprospiraceae bacterium]|nr:hypothetical protein [Saprospiraceae bacterium]
MCLSDLALAQESFDRTIDIISQSLKSNVSWKTERTEKKKTDQKVFVLDKMVIKENIKDSQAGYTLQISEAPTRFNPYEVLKENKPEGIFYNFDDVNNIIQTMTKGEDENGDSTKSIFLLQFCRYVSDAQMTPNHKRRLHHTI